MGGSSSATGEGSNQQLRKGKQRPEYVPDDDSDSGQRGSGNEASGQRTSQPKITDEDTQDNQDVSDLSS